MKSREGYHQTRHDPTTAFPLRGHLYEREADTLRRWERLPLQEGGDSILRSAPVFTFPALPVSQAVTLIHADILLTMARMRGRQAPLQLAWHVHGLPTEILAVRDFPGVRGAIDTPALRAACATRAQAQRRRMEETARRLGIRAAWAATTDTAQPASEADVLDLFAQLVEQDLIYRARLPVAWCPTCRSVLARSETAMGAHTRPLAHLAIPAVAFPPACAGVSPARCAAVVATTQPWAIPALTALAVDPAGTYALVADEAERDGFIYLIAHARIEHVAHTLGMRKPFVRLEVPGTALLDASFMHPVTRAPLPVLADAALAAAAPTGMAGVMPAHDADAFAPAVAHGIPCPDIVGEDARLTAEAGVGAGKTLERGGEALLRQMDRDGTLLAFTRETGEDPLCWHCRGPVITRALPQWFLRVAPLIEPACALASQVAWQPAWGRAEVTRLLRGHPDWCLSRQRGWGTPLPIFRCEACGTPILEAPLIRLIAARVRAEGSDAWAHTPTRGVLPPEAVCAHCGSDQLSPERAVFDVRFTAACHALVGAEAEMSLEGPAAYRGWWQGAFVLAAALRRTAPLFRRAINSGATHEGAWPTPRFTLVPESPTIDRLIRAAGADPLRLWAAMGDPARGHQWGAVPWRAAQRTYRRVRNIFHGLLGHLADVTPAPPIPTDALPPLERWALARLQVLVADVTRALDAAEPHRAIQAILAYGTTDLSAGYLAMVHELLVLGAAHDPARRAAQSALARITETLAVLLAPVLPFLADEVWQHLPAEARAPAAHLASWPVPDPALADPALVARWSNLRALRREVLRAVSSARHNGRIAHQAHAKLTVYLAGEWASVRESLENLFPRLLRVSAVEVRDWASRPAGALPLRNGVALEIGPAEGERCARCRYLGHPGGDAHFPGCCVECTEILHERVPSDADVGNATDNDLDNV